MDISYIYNQALTKKTPFQALYDKAQKVYVAWDENQLKRLLSHKDYYCKEELSQGDSNDALQSICICNVWDSLIDEIDKGTIKNCISVFRTLEEINQEHFGGTDKLPDESIVDFVLEVKKKAPAVSNSTRGGANDDDKSAAYIKNDAQIPFCIKLLVLTTEKLRFLLYNSRKGLCSKLFSEISPNLIQQVFDWIALSEVGNQAVTINDVSSTVWLVFCEMQYN